MPSSSLVDSQLRPDVWSFIRSIVGCSIESCEWAGVEAIIGTVLPELCSIGIRVSDADHYQNSDCQAKLDGDKAIEGPDIRPVSSRKKHGCCPAIEISIACRTRVARLQSSAGNRCTSTHVQFQLRPHEQGKKEEEAAKDMVKGHSDYCADLQALGISIG